MAACCLAHLLFWLQVWRSSFTKIGLPNGDLTSELAADESRFGMSVCHTFAGTTRQYKSELMTIADVRFVLSCFNIIYIYIYQPCESACKSIVSFSFNQVVQLSIGSFPPGWDGVKPCPHAAQTSSLFCHAMEFLVAQWFLFSTDSKFNEHCSIFLTNFNQKQSWVHLENDQRYQSLAQPVFAEAAEEPPNVIVITEPPRRFSAGLAGLVALGIAALAGLGGLLVLFLCGDRLGSLDFSSSVSTLALWQILGPQIHF